MKNAKNLFFITERMKNTSCAQLCAQVSKSPRVFLFARVCVRVDKQYQRGMNASLCILAFFAEIKSLPVLLTICCGESEKNLCEGIGKNLNENPLLSVLSLKTVNIW